MPSELCRPHCRFKLMTADVPKSEGTAPTIRADVTYMLCGELRKTDEPDQALVQILIQCLLQHVFVVLWTT